MANFTAPITLLANELDLQRQALPTYSAKERGQLEVLRELVSTLELLGHVNSGRPLTLVREKAARVAAKGRA